MVQLTFLVAIAAVSASPAHGTTRHLTPPSLRQSDAAQIATDEVGSGALRQVKYDAPPVDEATMMRLPESAPVHVEEASVMHYESAPLNYGPSEAYYDRTSRRSDDYYHGCEQYVGIWSKHCLPSPWCCPGNMRQHFPYEATPHFYYYFRPYNAAQIGPQQVVAEAWVANPRLPYANGVFDEVYREFDAKFAPPAEAIDPLAP
ncbi:hypothetical protein M4951_06600 [Blastopirellula sp. J2-11]|uniref:hypothetical protein n=1 Tax=Blastopirellula sp. J2-11 TaxID=2943192 RepID=UPI0021C777DB|nr:hypothetical protein [Blastopirellula sp. J2-11]UUO07980.1 hypothetical protein M4951_06600 [Blastopirellula sp. J2-11]